MIVTICINLIIVVTSGHSPVELLYSEIKLQFPGKQNSHSIRGCHKQHSHHHSPSPYRLVLIFYNDLAVTTVLAPVFSIIYHIRRFYPVIALESDCYQ